MSVRMKIAAFVIEQHAKIVGFFVITGAILAAYLTLLWILETADAPPTWLETSTTGHLIILAVGLIELVASLIGLRLLRKASGAC